MPEANINLREELEKRIRFETLVSDISARFVRLSADKVEELNNRFPDVKIIVLGEYDEPNVVDDIMLAGASAYVLKQYAGTDLFDAIEWIQKGQPFISPAIKKHNVKEENER